MVPKMSVSLWVEGGVQVVWYVAVHSTSCVATCSVEVGVQGRN